MSPLRGDTLAGLPKKYPKNGAVRNAKLEHLTEIYSLIELLESNRWLLANKLSLNIAKTEFMVIGSRRRLATFDDHELCVTVNGASVKQVKSAKTLGITLDENLTWRNHVDAITKKISSGIGALKRVRGLIDQETANRAYQGFIEPYFSYCAPVWDGLGNTLSDRLQILQNRAARVITRSSYDISSNLLLDQLKWNNLSVNRQKQKAILIAVKHLSIYMRCLPLEDVSIPSGILMASCLFLNLILIT